MSDSKRNSLNRKINLKNKEEVKKVLTKKNNVTKAKKATVKKKQSTYNKKRDSKNKNVVKKEETKNITEEKILSKEIKGNNEKKSKKDLVKNKVSQKVKSNSNSNNKAKKNTLKNKPLTKNNNRKTTKEIEKNIANKIKSKIFEEVEEKEITKEEKNSNNKKIIIISILILLVIAISLIFIKYNDKIKKTLNIYPEYFIGEEIILKDNSIWYVIEDSDSTNNAVKLIKKTQIDINGDGIFDEKDKKKYSSVGNDVYDVTDKDSVAYYLETDYKKYLTKNVGNIKEISLITSKEFIKARSKMGYGYEWSEGNWLANSSLGVWWINSSQNKKIYAVSKNGSYKIYEPSKSNYVRPVITIEKDLVQKKD